jgi:hypothetical protein
MRLILKFLLVFLIFYCIQLSGESTRIALYLNVHYEIDGVVDLDRNRFFNIHGPAAMPDDFVSFVMDELDVSFGRVQSDNIGPRAWETFERSGVDNFRDWANANPAAPIRNRIFQNYLDRVSLVGTGVGQPPALLDGPEEFIRTKNSVFYYRDLDEMVDFTMDTFRTQLMPRFHDRIEYFELSNEPVGWWAHDWGRLADLYVAVGKRFKEEHPDIFFGGPCMFSPYVFTRNFSPWNDGLRPFIDKTGHYLSALAFHSYDFYTDSTQNAFSNDGSLVTGAHHEARLDLLENHSLNQFGFVHKLFLSEVGGYDTQLHNDPGAGNDPALALEKEELLNWLMINSVNRKTLSFVNRPGRILKSIPFILLDTSAWNENYYAAMLRRTSGRSFRVTTLRHFFDLWAGIRGQRFFVGTDDHNIVVAGFIDGQSGSLIIDNMSLRERTLDVHAVSEGWSVKSVERLYFDHSSRQVQWSQGRDFDLQALPIGGHEKIRINFDTMPNPGKESRLVSESWFYGDRTVEPIRANQTHHFTFEAVNPQNPVEGVLRVAVGRAHDLSRQPEVIFNGKSLALPTENWGGDQSLLPAFFGVIPIRVPADLIQDVNKVAITFPDGGGDLSTVILVVRDTI